MRLIDKDGEQVGVVPVAKAFEMAEAAGMDLAMVADKVTPPVCRILDYGKLVFDSKKKQRDNRKRQHAQKLKEIKFHVNIDPHDYTIKTGHAVDFLQKGYKVRISLVFRGREMAHREMGMELIERLKGDLSAYGTPEGSPQTAGRTISMNIAAAPHH